MCKHERTAVSDYQERECCRFVVCLDCGNEKPLGTLWCANLNETTGEEVNNG